MTNYFKRAVIKNVKRISKYLVLLLPLLGFINVPIVSANVLFSGVNTGRISNRIISPDQSIGSIVSFAVAFIVVLSFLLALIFIVIGAVQWITSGGDKQKVADARNHIISAIIGLIIVALSFVIVNIVITALGLGSLTNLTIPTLSEFGQ